MLGSTTSIENTFRALDRSHTLYLRRIIHRDAKDVLTLSYSSESSPALAEFRHHYLKIVLSLLYLYFLSTSFLFLVWWHWHLKHCLRVSLLTLGPSCPLLTILLSDLVECGRLLQKVMAVWRTFFFILNAPNSHYSLHLTQHACSNSKERGTYGHFYLQRAFLPDWIGITALWGHITGVFFQGQKKPLRIKCGIYFWWIWRVKKTWSWWPRGEGGE